MSNSNASQATLESASFPSVEVAKCPFEFYGALRSQAPVYQLPDRPSTYVLSRFEDVRRALRDERVFSSRDVMKPAVNAHGSAQTMVFSDPPDHAARRKLISQAFTGSRVKSYAPMIRSYTAEIIDSFIGRGRVEFTSEFAMPLPLHVTGELLGIPRDERMAFRRFSVLEGIATEYLPPNVQTEHAKLAAELGEYMTGVVQSRLANPGDDLISELIAAQVKRDGAPDVAYLVIEGIVLLVAGFVTTVHLMESAMLLLVRNPDVMDRCVRDHAAIPQLIEETLRLESPVQWSPRVVVEDVEIQGVRIPAGSTVLCTHAAANRDEDRFACPENVDLDRPRIKDHLGFSSGIHTCLGAPLARLESTIALEQLLTRLRNIRLEDPSAEVLYPDMVSFRGPTQLPLVFDAS